MTSVFLSFNLKENAEKFVAALLDHGMKTEDISVVAREAGQTFTAEQVEKDASTGISTTTAADFSKGAVIGGTAGIGLGVILGLATLFVPGVGIVAGAGALATAIAATATTGAAGALVGGIAGYMRDMGVEGEVPDEFERDYADDYVIVAVALRADGLASTEIANLADKYHATRTTLTQPAVAAVPVVERKVETHVVETSPGQAVVATVVKDEPVGIETVPTVSEKELEPTRPGSD